MPKSRSKKEQEVKSFLDNAKKMKSAVFVQYHKLTVKDEREVRKLLRDSGNTYHALKKTLLTRALKEMQLDFSGLEGNAASYAVAFSHADEISAAKILQAFAKTHESIKLVGGMYNGSVIGKAEVLSLANLPSKEELLAKLVYVVSSPLRDLVGVLNGPLRSLVQVLEAVQKAKPAS